MWKSRKYLGKHEMLSENSEPMATTLLICPTCLMGQIDVSEGVGTCIDCGTKLDLEDFQTEADAQISTNALGQTVVTYTVLC